MLPVVMEAAMCDQRTWVGPVGILGPRMYVNCSTTDDVDGIMKELKVMGVSPNVVASSVGSPEHEPLQFLL